MPTKFGQTGWIHEDEKVQREFERVAQNEETIAKAVESLLPEGMSIDDAAGNTGEDKSGEIKTNIWALTTEHNDNIVGMPKVVQDLDFKDKAKRHPKYELGINWDLWATALEASLSTIPDAQKTNIAAFAYTNPKQFLEWFDLCLQPIMSIQGTPDYRDGYWNYTIKLVNDQYSPGPNKLYGTDGFGSKGWQPLPVPSSGVLVFTIDYLTLTPVVIVGSIPINSTVQSVSLVITSAFNNTTIVELGDDGLFNRLMTVGENQPEVMNKYQSFPDYKYLVTTDIKLRFYYSSAPTTGSLTVYVYYH